MNQLMPFEHDVFGKIRAAIGPDGQPWFAAMDVAKALGYEDPSRAVIQHCRKCNKITQIGDSSKKPPRNINIVPEQDVYRLIMRSNMPIAERFQDWVCEDVLPSIRKHGMYATAQTVDTMLADPDTAIRMLTAFKQEQEARKEAEAKLAEAQPI